MIGSDETYLSVCDGIGGATEAFNPLGWKAALLSEIEGWPRALLEQRHGAVPIERWVVDAAATPLRGDFSAIRVRHLLRFGVSLPSMLIGGTPCQAFSVAGLRKSLDDARGNLTLSFVKLADALDNARSVRGLPPIIIVWENVPGVLSTGDNAFGCFLGALVGSDSPLVPGPKQRWTNAGVVVGPRRKAAWIVKDAQYFGVAQRRRRVFVVASSREGFDPSEILLEPDCMRWDPPARGSAGERPAAGPAPGAGGVGGEAGRVAAADAGGAGDRGADGGGRGVEQTYVGNAEGGATDLPFLTVSNLGKTVNNQTPLIGVEPAPTLLGGSRADGGYSHDNIPMVAVEAFAFVQNQREEVREVEVSSCLSADSGSHQQTYVATPVIGFTCKDSGQDASEDLSPTLRSMGFTDSHANGGGQVAVAYAMQAGVTRQNIASGPDGAGISEERAYTLEARPEVQIVAFAVRGREEGAVPEVEGSGDTVGTLRSASGGSSRDFVAMAFDVKRGLAPHGAAVETELVQSLAASDHKDPPLVRIDDVAAFTVSQQSNSFAWEGDVHSTLDTSLQSGGNQRSGVRVEAAVRRLTPTECERLQGYRDGYTLIAWRGKTPEECPDGPRYRALGNSWAVPCVHWIGLRIQAEVIRSGAGANDGAPGVLWGANGPVEYRLAA